MDKKKQNRATVKTRVIVKSRQQINNDNKDTIIIHNRATGETKIIKRNGDNKENETE